MRITGRALTISFQGEALLSQLQVVGGNKTGVFVHAVTESSAAHTVGIGQGAQILEVSNVRGRVCVCVSVCMSNMLIISNLHQLHGSLTPENQKRRHILSSPNLTLKPQPFCVRTRPLKPQLQSRKCNSHSPPVRLCSPGEVRASPAGPEDGVGGLHAGGGAVGSGAGPGILPPHLTTQPRW